MPTENPIRILIADDHFVVREGLAAVIGRQEDMRVVAEAGDGAEAVALYRQHQPDVAIMDLSMPVLDGIEAVVRIRKEYADAKIVMLTVHEGDMDILRALEAGAKAYVLKGTTSKELLQTIRQVHGGTYRLGSGLARRLAERIGEAPLTAREIAVIEQMAQGASNREIADELRISVGTVKAHITHIMTKLDVKSRTQIVYAATKKGYIRLR